MRAHRKMLNITALYTKEEMFNWLCGQLKKMKI